LLNILLEDLPVSAPTFTARSRLILFAPHPDDESLACGVMLQRAVRAGAAIRVVYATDGDDNPWPQRVLERKWRLDATDRRRWGRLRRSEALAALRVLGVNASAACFLALPDQKLTAMLMCDCRSALERFATIIADWEPTDLLVPSISDTHPDHSALAVMVRLALSESISSDVSVWNYAVHGKSAAFFQRAMAIPQSESEMARKLRAIRCHKTQLKLSKKRFLGYAARPERLVKLEARDKIITDGSISSIWREPDSLRIELRLSPKAARPAEPTLFILGRDNAGVLRCLRMRLPVRSSRVEMLDCTDLERFAVARYRGNALAGELAIPVDSFCPAHRLFVKLERRSWFFDEAGWLEVSSARFERIAASERNIAHVRQVAAR
jgi:LmbE family N-acetylglucosaminyl deacetylase